MFKKQEKRKFSDIIKSLVYLHSKEVLFAPISTLKFLKTFFLSIQFRTSFA